jgi:hypothetical protein
MDVLQRRRQFFGKGIAYVTFYGNGGVTATGDVTVVIPVARGAEWRYVAVPDFFNGIKERSGFTVVRDDDNTLVESDYTVTSDMVVYASYTAIEVGVVTRAGKVYSATNWGNKFGRKGSPDALYRFDENGEASGLLGFLDDYDAGNLIEFVFFKAGAKAFGARSNYNEGGVSYGSYLPVNTKYIPDEIYTTANALDDIVFYADGTNNEAGKIPSVYYRNISPYTSIPDDFTLLINSMYGNGKAYTAILDAKLNSLGYSSEVIALLKNQKDPFGLNEHAYFVSLYEADLIFRHRSVFLEVFKTIDRIMRPVNGGTSASSVSKFLASYRGSDMSGSGFTQMHDNLVNGESVQIGCYTSNIYHRIESSQAFWRTCTYTLFPNGSIQVNQNGYQYINGLFVLDLSALF